MKLTHFLPLVPGSEMKGKLVREGVHFFVGYALGHNNHCFSGYFSELDLDEC